MQTETVVFKNFRLNVFKNLMEQSLMVTNQLMINLNKDIMKACSYSSTNTFIKLWAINLNNLIIKPDTDGIIDFDNTIKEEELKFPEFDFYILRGDLFKKFLTVFNFDTVDIEFTLELINNKYQATTLIVSGEGTDQTMLKTTFSLTTEELISNKIEDYSAIIKELTPSKKCFEFILSSKQVQEIKRLIKNLHKSNSNNSAYLTFTVDTENKKIIVNDKVFVLNIILSNELQNELKFPEESFNFNILKSDFIMTGNHDFTFYVNSEETKIILGARYMGALIWGLTTKIEISNININEAALDASIDALNIEEYM